MNRNVFVKRSIRFFFFSVIFPVFFFLFFFVAGASAEPDSAQQDTPPAEINVEVVHLKTVKLNTVGFNTVEIKLYPEEVLQGEIYQDKGNYKKAEKLYQQALDKYAPPDSTFVTVGHLMQLYQAGGDLAEIDKDLKAKIPSEDAFVALKHLVQLYLETKDLDKAEKILEKESPWVLQKEKSLDLFLNLAERYYEEGNYRKAKEIFRKIVDHFPAKNEQVGQATYLLGDTLYRLGELEESNKYFQRAFQYHPYDPLAFHAQMLIYRNYGKLGKRPEEKLALEKLAADYPESKQAGYANYQLGDLNFASGNWPEAITAYKEALKQVLPQSNQTARILDQLAACYEKTDNLDDARQIYLRLVKEFPPDNEYGKKAKKKLDALEIKQ
jgi:tetratricopeptide (TPR) repeat protein